ncbi:unnamed protein product [Linum tenue]|uniref:Uncharacterized protein n=1 Tax=Linum tenue TaxID=586396 RepID=A0AAV0PXK3_9ROSI|nr:unnamed protein product [Linum tenue]CAI0475927.1 unnamed protein product [Linum tenue]CAI0476035.1 unnamed protein product [Linum tenue]CAI0476036.1 unnamed protein product [Linum tenue]
MLALSLYMFMDFQPFGFPIGKAIAMERVVSGLNNSKDRL